MTTDARDLGAALGVLASSMRGGRDSASATT
jgi:hypothetical protein